MENLVLLRNVDAHTYEPIHDPGAVAALAGTLLMLVEHAGSVKGDLLEALGRCEGRRPKGSGSLCSAA